MTTYTFRIRPAMTRAQYIQQLVANDTIGHVDSVQEAAAHLLCALHMLHECGYDARQVLTVALLPICAEVIAPAPKDESELH